MTLLPRNLKCRWPLVLAVVIAGVFCLAGVVVLYRFDPELCRLCPPCLFHVITGLYCPGCGSARALHQLLHGHLAAALMFNPLLIATLLLVCCAVVVEGVSAATRRAIPVFRPNWRFARGILYVTVAYWVLRNIPIYPFTLLAPGGIAPWK